jgi:hypothetical protein
LFATNCSVADFLGAARGRLDRGPGHHSRISDEAKALCQALGFGPSPGEPMTLTVTLADIGQLLS